MEADAGAACDGDDDAADPDLEDPDLEDTGGVPGIGDNGAVEVKIPIETLLIRPGSTESRYRARKWPPRLSGRAA